MSPSDSWRAIVLFGLNTATYKMALGNCLYGFAERGVVSVTMGELAEAFFEAYLERLKLDRPQLSTPGRLTVMERVVQRYMSGALSREAAIEEVERNAFGDVIDRFHTVARIETPVKFYERTAKGITLTDALHTLVDDDNDNLMVGELMSRWAMLEAAFEMMRDEKSLVNDLRAFYLANGYERRNITHMRPVLNGYQHSICFYCAQQMDEGDVHVDHVIPRQFVYHDEVWNLVLAHEFCNEQKSDALPGSHYMEKLIQRNEALILSNHPLKAHLIRQLGSSASARRETVSRVYSDAAEVIRYTWQGVRGYNPATDPFYRGFVRELTRS